MKATPSETLKQLIREIPDFPKKGVLFKDITPLLKSPEHFKLALTEMVAPFDEDEIAAIVGIESRGFIFGAALAERLGVPFIPVRKEGKLPHHKIKEEYALEYGTSAVEIHKDAVRKGDKVLLIDDVLATGGTLLAACKLIETLGGKVLGISVLIELEKLEGRKKLDGYGINALVKA